MVSAIRSGPRAARSGDPVRADVSALWQALFTGKIVPAERVAEMVRPRRDVPEERKRYGLGFWLHPRSGAVALEGYDAGVSFRSVCDPGAGIIHTVISNWTDGAWPLARHLRDRLTPEPPDSAELAGPAGSAQAADRPLRRQDGLFGSKSAVP